MFPNIHTGARARVLINNKPVAAAFVADWSIETGASEINTLDSVFPLELAPDRVKVSMNLRVYRTQDNDPVLDEIVAGGNDISQPEQNNFTQSPYIAVEIKDLNDVTIIYLPKAWIVRRTAGLSHGDLMTENWSIISMGYRGPSA